jgi:hypothetical protein
MQAIEWSKRTLSVQSDNTSNYYLTQINLLYKVGKTTDAIDMAKNAVAKMGDESKQFSDLLTKINNGDKIW